MLSKDISSIRVKMLFLPLRLRCSCALHRWNQVLCFLRDYAPRSPSTLGTLHAVLPFLARMLLCTCRQKTLSHVSLLNSHRTTCWCCYCCYRAISFLKKTPARMQTNPHTYQKPKQVKSAVFSNLFLD